MKRSLRDRILLLGEDWVERGGRGWLVVWRGRAWISRFPWLYLLLGAFVVELPGDDRARGAELAGGIRGWRRAYYYEAVVPHLETALEDERPSVD